MHGGSVEQSRSSHKQSCWFRLRVKDIALTIAMVQKKWLWKKQQHKLSFLNIICSASHLDLMLNPRLNDTGGVCAASAVFALLALALPYWSTVEIYDGNIGLFRVCVNSKCQNIDPGDPMDVNPDKEDAFRACQAMVLLGFFAVVGSLVVFVLLMFVLKGRKMLGYIAGALAVAGGFCLMVGMAVYADNFKSPGFDFGAGFAMDILGWLTAWAAGGIMLFTTFTGAAESS